MPNLFTDHALVPDGQTGPRVGSRPGVLRVGVAHAERRRRQWSAVGASVPDVIRVMHHLSADLLRGVVRHLGPSLSGQLVPVVILRGGLLMRQASREVFGDRPWGLVKPHPRERGAPVTVATCDVPLTEGPLLLLDPVVNSGQTILATVDYLAGRMAGFADDRVKLASVFLTDRGEQAIRRARPRMQIYTVYDRMQVRDNGWIAGVDFDAGDYAMGGGNTCRIR